MDDLSKRETTDRAHVEPLDKNYRGLARIPAARRWLFRKLAEAERLGNQSEQRRLRRQLGMSE